MVAIFILPDAERMITPGALRKCFYNGFDGQQETIAVRH